VLVVVVASGAVYVMPLIRSVARGRSTGGGASVSIWHSDIYTRTSQHALRHCTIRAEQAHCYDEQSIATRSVLDSKTPSM
jgi:hypothetical protein